jgi:Carboxypeptidase regulatory-like domain
MRKLEVCSCVLISALLGISCTALCQDHSSSHQPSGSEKVPVAPARTSAPSSPNEQPATNAESTATKLPVRRVILYKSGVGYFEHLGSVRGDQTVRIDFTSSQLNDVLQSLTVFDLNGGRISGVNYNSEAPLSQRLGTLRLPLTEQTDVSKFYGALRGARLEVRNGSAVVTGRLLSIERKTRVSGGTTLEVDLITLVSDSGEVRSIEVTPAVSVRLADRDVNDEVTRYLGLLSSVRQEDLRRMTISTSGSGDRRLYVSYISEVPVWKTTYRIVLPTKTGDEPLLQGWAIVDNTVGEDWNNVELSLVAGAPQSFIQQLSQPYYARRPVIALPQLAQLTPQTHESAMLGGLASVSGTITDPQGAVISDAQVKLLDASGNLVASKSSDNAGGYSFADVPAGSYRLEASKSGFQTTAVFGLSLGGGTVRDDISLRVGSVATTVTVMAQNQSLDAETSEAEVAGSAGSVGSGRELGSSRGVGGRGSGSGSGVGPGVGGGIGGGMFSAGASSVTAAARGQDLGDLFEYKLQDRVTIHKNESSLVPILQEHVAVEKVSLWNSTMGTPRPLRALWLTNSSPLTLDGGSFSILEDEAFAGEGLTDSIKPGEKRLLSYAADLGVRAESTGNLDPQRVTHVRIAHGAMIQTNESRQETIYTIRDDDTTPRTILIEHPLRIGWTISSDGPKPDETTLTSYRFRVKVDPKSSATLTIRESSPIESRYALTNLTDDQIKLFLQQRSINSAVEAEFRKIVEQKGRVAALDAEISKRDDEKQKIYDDQQRLRENMKALKGSAEERALTQRYTQQLANQEGRLEAIERESVDLQAKHDEAQGVLDNMIESLTLDATI